MTRIHTCLLVLVTALLSSDVAIAQAHLEGTSIEGRAVWATPETIAQNDSSALAFVDQCRRANINLIVLLVEASDKQVFFHSKKFPESVAPEFRDFDPLEAVIRHARGHAIRVHAWLCDFLQSGDGPLSRQHPEWLVRNPDGNTPSEVELLGGGMQYTDDWMCPAQRPGYTDQWLIPLIEEIVANYDVDGIHHDYVRYVGDVAPDEYCFCDYCLDAMMRFAHFSYEAYPDSFFSATPTLPKAMGNWWSDPTVKPQGWDSWDRKKKTQFLVTGSFMKGGPSDLDYFFYTFRQEQINRFVREAWEHASAIKPDIEFSAAVFKNPVASGRFIGQRWMEFSPWIDLMMPMVYRSHFPPVDFDTFLAMLEEYTRYEYRWTKDRAHLSVGLDVHYMYNEERLFLSDALHLLDSLKVLRGAGRTQYVQRIQTRYALLKDHLARVAPAVEKKLTPGILGLPDIDGEQLVHLQDIVASLNANPPDDYFPKEKLRRAIEAVRKGGGNGIVIFDGGGLTTRRLWPVLEELFREPSVEPYTVSSAADMSITRLREHRKELASARQRFWYLGGFTLLLAVALVIAVRRKRGAVQNARARFPQV